MNLRTSLYQEAQDGFAAAARGEDIEPTHEETKQALNVALYALTLLAGDDAPRILNLAAKRLRPVPVPVSDAPCDEEPKT